MTIRYCLHIILLSFLSIPIYSQVKPRADTTRTDTTTLHAAKVTALRPATTAYTDKIVVNVQNNITGAGGSALDILANVPGLTVDNNDNIRIRGREGILFQIDGKPLQTAPTDLAAILKGLPASSIDKIEIITQPSARYDAAGTAGIINIKLKKDDRLGTNGAMTINAGQGKYPKAGAGFSINSHHQALNLFLSYNYLYRQMFNHLRIDRRFYDSSHYTGGDVQDNYFKYEYNTHVVKGGIDYNPTSATSISLSATTLSNTYAIHGDNIADKKDAGFNTVSVVPLHMLSSNHPDNYAVSFSLKHVPDTTGKSLNIDLDYARYNDSKKEIFSNGVSDHQQGQLDIYALKADYTTRTHQNITAAWGLKSSIVQSQHTLDFMPPPLITRFRYHENINAAYAEGHAAFDHWRMDLGLRLENTNNDSSWLQFFPSLNLTRKLPHHQELTLFANRRTDRPNYSQLSPLRIYIDATTYKVGNPYLMPQLSDAAGLTYNYANIIIATLTYSVTYHTMRTVFIPDSTLPGVTYQTDKNLDRYRYAGFNTSFNYTLTSWWSMLNNILVYYSYINADLLHSSLNKGNTALQFTSSNKFSVSTNYKAELNAVYNSSFLDAYIYNYPTFNLSIGLQRSVLKEKGTLRMNVTDCFYASYLHAYSNIDNLTEAFTSKRESRVLNLAFSYAFGRKAVPQAKQITGGAEEEKRRAN